MLTLQNRNANSLERRDWRGVYLIAALAMLAVAILLCFLAFQLTRELHRLQAASTDNVQWSMAQAQVELLTLREALDTASHDPDGRTLADLRQRFDIFYSRVDTLKNGSFFDGEPDDAKAPRLLDGISETLDRLIPAIDGSDAVLAAALPEMVEAFAAIQPAVREIALEGVRVRAERSDLDRRLFTELVLRTALVAGILLIAMVLALVMFIWQFRVARQKTAELQMQNRLHESAINASLDAILVSDENARVLDFSPAAEALFGYSRDEVLGKRTDQLIIPPEEREQFRERRASYLGKEVAEDVHLSGRLEIDLIRADGTRFPAELSVAVIRSGTGRLIVTYLRDISDRLRTQEALTRARDDAVATAKAKSDFLAVMSHEMRTPLNGVMGLLDMLSETRLTRKQRDYVRTAITSGEILQRHIDDVLNINRIESGVTRLSPGRFEVLPLLTELKKMNEPAALARHNTITVDAPSGVVFAQDRHGLRQVLINLVGNAVKFTENGHITVTARPQGSDGSMAFVVEDTGIGIAAEDAARIFEDFVMLDPSYKRTAPGSGLGLAISRRLVELMGGEIGVESEPGRGSRFFLHLPPLTAPDEAESEADVEPPPADPGPKTPLSVLIVEDNETNRFVAREMLSRYGCQVSEARDGIEGVEAAEKTRFDVIFMDISMPRLDGLGATRAIRGGDGASRETPIIGLTAHALPEEQKQLIEAGMQDCIVKPLRTARIAEVMASLSERRTTDAPARKPIPSGLVDRRTVTELLEALPPEMFRRQIDRFISELGESRERFCARPEDRQDLEALAACAHKMAGSAAVFGAVALRAHLLEIESAARHGERDQLDALCDSVLKTAEQTLAALKTIADDPAL
ncbi:PAS domain-containing hybrid sensor histidine kinase/response regulator [Martelella endophytica]|uniref:histidine kinase n=1 Tax=Martelella endophytica TaxID=1486262 RepID=A0A0D5LKA6_MAREN|nr:ATP-binding protein [Martelella endophytica]AJY44629.1 hypothetical protein TM49_01320 [Martelella endophytica]